jgi:hypothetical protein
MLIPFQHVQSVTTVASFVQIQLNYLVNNAHSITLGSMKALQHLVLVPQTTMTLEFCSVRSVATNA